MNIKKNYIYNVLCEILTTLIAFILLPYVSRILRPEGMGRFVYVIACADCFIIFARLGLHIYGNRSIAKAKDDKEKCSKVFSGIFYQQVILTLIILVLFIIYAVFFAKENKQLMLLLSTYVFATAFELNWLYYGLENFKFVSLNTIIFKALTAIAVFLFLKSVDDLYKYVFITGAVMLIQNMVLLFNSKRYVNFKFLTLKQISSHFMPCLILFVPIVAVGLYRTMDKIMLGLLSTSEQVGLYQAASQLQSCLLGTVTALGMVMLPRISNLVEKGKNKLVLNYMDNSMHFSMFLACGVAFGIASIARWFIPVFYGDEFLPAHIITYILTPSIIAIAWANVIRVHYIIPNNLDKVLIISVCLGAIINLFLNILLIAKFKAQGAGFSTFIAELSIPIVQYLYLRKELPFKTYIKNSACFVMFGIVMFIIVCFAGIYMEKYLNTSISEKIFAISIQILIGAGVYSSLCYVYVVKINKQNIIGRWKN